MKLNPSSPTHMNSLVQTEAAASFLSLAGTEAGRKAFLGDVSKYETGVGPEIVNAHIALRDGVATIGKLLQDPTRNEVQKHEAAGIVAGRTIEVLEKSKAGIESRAEILMNDGVAQAEREFAPRASHASLESEIRTYIREQTKKPGGMASVRAVMQESKDAAAVIYHSPSFLVGINAETHSKLRIDATQRWIPDAYKRLADSVALRELAPKFDKAIGSVRSSFYSPALAAKAKLRVQI